MINLKSNPKIAIANLELLICGLVIASKKVVN